jgi:hypothetical protein
MIIIPVIICQIKGPTTVIPKNPNNAKAGIKPIIAQIRVTTPEKIPHAQAHFPRVETQDAYCHSPELGFGAGFGVGCSSFIFFQTSILFFRFII